MIADLVAAATTTTSESCATSIASTTALTIAVSIAYAIIAIAIVEELIVAVTAACAAVCLEAATPVACAAVANAGAFLWVAYEATILNTEKFARNTTANAALISDLSAVISETSTVKLAHYLIILYVREKNSL